MALVRLAALLLIASCARFDATETIELVPDQAWSASEVETLRHAASCWKQQFGIPFTVVDAPTTAQSVRVGFGDFVCWTALGRFTPGEPAQISLCPLAKWPANTVIAPEELHLFTVLDHELGHAAGIRSEGSDRDAIMGRGEAIPPVQYRRVPPLAFQQEDADLIAKEVPRTGAPACTGRVVLVNDAETGAACGCQLDVLAMSGHVMAYDEARGETILFSGASHDPSGTVIAIENRTWSWKGNAWTELTPASSPPPRYSAAMAYDSRRKRMVMFGGAVSFNNAIGDTWEWDGATWIETTPAQSPPSRYDHSMAYDPVRGRVVLFGGVSKPLDSLGDTWEYDGTTWVEIPSMTVPSPRDDAAMAFDPVRHTVMLFGGYGTDQLGDQWEWDGAEWKEVTSSTMPSARNGLAMVTDTARGKVMLFGGVNYVEHATYFGDLWEWDGTMWSSVGTPAGPPGRYDHQLAFDTARGQLVLVGGGSPYTVPDTWEWDGTRWRGFAYQQCGDGVLEVGETCDDGGMASGDGCDEMCQVE